MHDEPDQILVMYLLLLARLRIEVRINRPRTEATRAGDLTVQSHSGLCLALDGAEEVGYSIQSVEPEMTRLGVLTRKGATI